MFIYDSRNLKYLPSPEVLIQITTAPDLDMRWDSSSIVEWKNWLGHTLRMLWAKVSNKSKWYFTARKGAEETEDFLANCPNLKHFTCLALSTPTPSTIDLHSADCRRDHSLSWISLRSTDRSFVRLSIYSFVLTRAAAATTAVSPHVYKACLWAVIMRSTHLTMLA